MFIKSLAFLSIRVLSICFFVLGVRYIGNVVSSSLPGFVGVNDPSYNEFLIRLSIPAIVFIVFSIILWIFSERISNYLVLKEAKEDLANIDIAKIEPIVYSVLGVILLVFSIPELIRYISQALTTEKDIMMYYQRYIWQIYSSIAVETIKIIFGICLVLQANTIKKITHRLREMGTDK